MATVAVLGSGEGAEPERNGFGSLESAVLGHALIRKLCRLILGNQISQPHVRRLSIPQAVVHGTWGAAGLGCGVWRGGCEVWVDLDGSNHHPTHWKAARFGTRMLTASHGFRIDFPTWGLPISESPRALMLSELGIDSFWIGTIMVFEQGTLASKSGSLWFLLFQQDLLGILQTFRILWGSLRGSDGAYKASFLLGIFVGSSEVSSHFSGEASPRSAVGVECAYKKLSPS